MKPLVLPLLLLIAAALGYYVFFYPPQALKHRTQKALTEFAEVVQSHDRSRINAALSALLATPSQVHLEVRFFSLAQTGEPPMVQEFDKASFVTFVDNLLYPLTDYDFWPQLESFSLDDKHIAHAQFSAKLWADGLSYYGGTGVAMRYSAEPLCDAELAFDGHQPLINKLSCRLELRAVPKPEEAAKLRDPAVLKQLLR